MQSIWKSFLCPILLSTLLFSSALPAKEKASPIIFCPKYVQDRDAATIFIQGAYLFWDVYQTGINIATQQKVSSSIGNIARPKLNPANGYKIKLSGSVDYDCWLASLEYTYLYYSPGTRQNPLLSPFEYTPNFADDDPTYSEISSRFEVIFNKVEAKLFRPSYLGYYMYYSSWLGLSATWDTQNFTYQGNTNALAFDDANLSQNWVGIGPYAGAEGCYLIFDPLGLYFSFGSTLYYCNHSVNNKIFAYENASLEGKTAINNSAPSIYAVELAMDSALGLRIEKTYPTWAICFNIGWELQMYFSHNGFLPYFSPTGNQGDFSMQGLTTSLQIGF